MYSKRDNIEIIINDKGDEVIKELFESLLSRYQVWLETSGVVILSLVSLTHRITNAIKWI